jgi:hypothetical protein
VCEETNALIKEEEAPLEITKLDVEAGAHTSGQFMACFLCSLSLCVIFPQLIRMLITIALVSCQ